MNNENIMENKKAGFAGNPFSSNQQKKDSNSNGVSGEELIYALYVDVNMNTEDEKDRKLTTKSKVINTTKRAEVQKLSNIYNILTTSRIIELRGNKGYFAIEPIEKALQAYKEEGSI